MKIQGFKDWLSNLTELPKIAFGNLSQKNQLPDISNPGGNERAMQFVTNRFVESQQILKPDETYTPKAVIIPLKAGVKEAGYKELKERVIRTTLEQNGFKPSHIEMEDLMARNYRSLDMTGYVGKDWEVKDLPGNMPLPAIYKDSDGRSVRGYHFTLVPDFQAEVVSNYRQVRGELAKPENIGRKAVVEMNVGERLQETLRISLSEGRYQRGGVEAARHVDTA